MSAADASAGVCDTAAVPWPAGPASRPRTCIRICLALSRVTCSGIDSILGSALWVIAAVDQNYERKQGGGDARKEEVASPME